MEIFEFINQNETVLWGLGILSLVTFTASLLVIPWLVVRIPVDYFAEEKRQVVYVPGGNRVLRWILLGLKNILGIVFIIFGIAMLVLPGQGLLTILIGILFLNFPGKYRLERYLIMLGPVHRTIDWLRRRAGRKPLVFKD